MHGRDIHLPHFIVREKRRYMETESMVTVRKHSIVLTADALDSALAYTNYFLRDLRSKLEEYHTEQARLHGGDRRPIRENDALTRDTDREIARAEQLAYDLELLRDELVTIYRWHFVQLAEVFRKTRIHLETERIEDLYTLKVALHFLMQMLSAENPKFDRQHFVDYINREEGGVHATAS
jgi:hypothetical protein